MARMRRIQVVIDAELDDRLAREATARGMSKSALVREGVERVLEQEPFDNGLWQLGERAERTVRRRGARRYRHRALRPARGREVTFVDSSYWIARFIPRDQPPRGGADAVARVGRASPHDDEPRRRRDVDVSPAQERASRGDDMARRGDRAARGADRPGRPRSRGRGVGLAACAQRAGVLVRRRNQLRRHAQAAASSEALAFDGDFAAAGFTELRV